MRSIQYTTLEGLREHLESEAHPIHVGFPGSMVTGILKGIETIEGGTYLLMLLPDGSGRPIKFNWALLKDKCSFFGLVEIKNEKVY